VVGPVKLRLRGSATPGEATPQRRPPPARGAAGAVGALLLAALLAAGCGQEERPDQPERPARVLVADASGAAAMAALPDGGLRFGGLETGIVRQADARGRVRPRPIARVKVVAGGQSGLLGLAVDRRDRTFAAWTAPGGRILVGRVAPGPTRLVWRGPPSARLANGGHLAFAPDGRLIVGIGDLQQPERVAEKDAPNGKLLSLSADGPPDQRPAVVSGGWNNPFAFTFTPAGALWVADNAPGDVPERLAPGGRPPRPSTFLELPPMTAPSGVAAISRTELAVCGVRSRRLERYRLRSEGRPPLGPQGAPLATDCSLGVVALADGRLAYATDRQIKVVAP